MSVNDERGRPGGGPEAANKRHDDAQNKYPPTCPDCAAVPKSGEYVHTSTCPLNRAVNRVIDKDRRWFAKRPGATERRRPVTPAEQADAELTYGFRPTGEVVVTQLRPGLRTRLLSDDTGEVRRG